MKYLLASALVFITSLLAYSQYSSNITGCWKLVKFEDFMNSGKALLREPFLDFEENSGKDTLKGVSFCNDIFGYYKIGIENNIRLKFGSTLMACTDDNAEEAWFKALSSVGIYLRMGDTLTLFYDTNRKKMVFVKKQVNNILTGKWQLVQFDEISRIKKHCQPLNHVVINMKDSALSGRLWGQSFCNGINGHYKINLKGKMVVPSFGGTKVACGCESQLWEAFHNVSGYQIKDDTLTIYYNLSDKMLFTKVK